MKRIFILIFFVIICVSITVPKTNPEPPNHPQQCRAEPTTRSFNNIHAWGDQLIGTNAIHSLSDFLNLGCIIDVTVKASKGCTYTWSARYTRNDSKIVGNSVKDIMIPNATDYTITVKVESPCARDSYLGRDVHLVWTKTISSLENNSSTELGYPTKADCASTRTVSRRSAVVSDYHSSGRIASSSTRELMMLQEPLY